MEGLDRLACLKKLYLEKNCISRLEGLQNCRQLEELYLSKQTLPPELEFTFDDYSLAAISVTNIMVV
jgi:protein phosphatase 1 regulatory subunit 42